MLSCRSINLYRSLAEKPWLSEEVQDNLGDGKACDFLADFENDGIANIYHVDESESGYACVRKVLEPQCYWTDASKLRYIGHGSQLSKQQFAEVEKLLAEAVSLSKQAKAYLDRVR